MANKCILAMVKPNLTDQVVDSAKKAGATGATIIPASGTGAGEAKTFFGLSLDIRTEVMLFLVSDAMVEPILSAIAGKPGASASPVPVLPWCCRWSRWPAWKARHRGKSISIF